MYSLVCFELGEYETAKKSFETGLKLLKKGKESTVLNRWIRKCDIEINGKSEDVSLFLCTDMALLFVLQMRGFRF